MPPARPRSAASRALDQGRRQLKDNRAQLLAIVDDIAPGPTSRYGIGPVSAAQAIVSFSHPGRCRNQAAFAPGRSCGGRGGRRGGRSGAAGRG
jgi:hypothetical protein